jgi:hypothetical protein
LRKFLQAAREERMHPNHWSASMRQTVLRSAIAKLRDGVLTIGSWPHWTAIADRLEAARAA